MVNIRKAAQVGFATAALATSASLFHKNRDYFRKVAWGSAAVSGPTLFFGGLLSYVRNNPFFSKRVVLGAGSLSFGTYVFFTIRGYLEKRETTQYILPDRDNVFYGHALSVGAATFVTTAFYSAVAFDMSTAVRAGLITGCAAGFVGHAGYELLGWWWQNEYRKQAIKLHFPYVWAEMEKEQAPRHRVSVSAESDDSVHGYMNNSNLYILYLLKDFYDTVTQKKSRAKELQLQLVEAQLKQETDRLEEVQMGLNKTDGRPQFIVPGIYF